MIEVLYLPSPTGSLERISPYLFTSVFNKLPVNGWQVVQEQDGLHLFLLGADENLRNEQVKEAIQQLFVRQGVLVPPLEVHRVTALHQTANGKTPVVISRIPPVV